MKNQPYMLGAGLLVAITIALGVSVVQGQNVGQSPTGGLQNGRFWLHSGSYEVTAEKEHRQASGVFKIDTATGRTWVFTADPANPKAAGKWEEVSQF